MEALNDLVRSGKVRYIGCSAFYAWEFQKANAIAKKNGWTEFVSIQNCYNLLYRKEERKMIPYCLDNNIANIHYSPLAKGLLISGSQKFTERAKTDPLIKAYFHKEEKSSGEIIDRVAKVADRLGHTPAQISFAWMLSKPHCASPIIGISREESLYEIIGSLDVKLSDEDIKYLEEPYIPHSSLIPM